MPRELSLSLVSVQCTFKGTTSWDFRHPFCVKLFFGVPYEQAKTVYRNLSSSRRYSRKTWVLVVVDYVESMIVEKLIIRLTKKNYLNTVRKLCVPVVSDYADTCRQSHWLCGHIVSVVVNYAHIVSAKSLTTRTSVDYADTMFT